MKRYSKTLVFLTMIIGASFANAIEISPDDRGQLLIAPVYKASVGQTTEIRVVNPSRTHAVKAAVGVRSAVNSLEILNFNLYLSPTDVWTGKLRDTGSGVELYSEDDSILVGFNGNGITVNQPIESGVFASPGNGVVFSTFSERDSGQQVELGHFEVLGVYSVSGPDIVPGMPKSRLFEIDNISYNNDTFIQNGIAVGGLFDGYAPVNTPYNCSGDKFVVSDLANHTGGLETQLVTPDGIINYCINTRRNISLFGEAVLSLSESSGAFRYDLLALRSGFFTGDVIGNPLYDTVTQQDTPIGVRMGELNSDGIATDNIQAINFVFRNATFEGIYDSLEPMAANSFITETGEAESMLVVTFPFKYRHLHSSSPDYTLPPVRRDSGRSNALIPIDLLNDNSSDRQAVDFDPDLDHYDYDFGYNLSAFNALNEFNRNGAVLGYPNHGRNGAFIYGRTATFLGSNNLDLFSEVTGNIISWDTSERFHTAATETSVISGGPGIDLPDKSSRLPNEVNVITDENDNLWFSTKGWYRATFSASDDFRPAPGIVMTLTTDTMGSSRIDYAVTSGTFRLGDSIFTDSLVATDEN